jgi:heme/copper-type cytochrome/quinol oxidase subunit 2
LTRLEVAALNIIFMSTLGVLILISGLIVTIVLAGKRDENYGASTKGNITRLTLIYVGLAIVLILGIGLYLYLT